jgi:DNA-binding CsgD family transcriptional regulator
VTDNASQRNADDSARIASLDGDLTAREREVLDLVGSGRVEAEIADALGIARSTVATLLRSSMAKLGAQTRVEAAAKAAANRR